MDNCTPYILAVTIQMMYVGMFLLNKAAFNNGMSSFVFVFYRQAFATIFLTPLAIIFERQRAPPLSLTAFCKIFMLSLLGITAAFNIHNLALIYTSPTLAAAILNTLPVITFVLAVLIRIEAINIRTLPGAIKIFGIVLCLVGAATISFYKGPHLNPLIHHHSFGHRVVAHLTTTWIKGCFLMLTSIIFWALWLVLQGRVIESYPSKLLFTTLQCFLSTIQSFIVAVAFERSSPAWKLHLDIGLLAVAYCGVIVTGVGFYLQAWCIVKRGPVFLAISSPLSFVLTLLCSVLFLGESVSLGSVLGGIFLVGGLYSVLLGKSKEQTEEKLTRAEVESKKESSNIVHEEEKRKAECLPECSTV